MMSSRANGRRRQHSPDRNDLFPVKYLSYCQQMQFNYCWFSEITLLNKHNIYHCSSSVQLTTVCVKWYISFSCKSLLLHWQGPLYLLTSWFEIHKISKDYFRAYGPLVWNVHFFRDSCCLNIKTSRYSPCNFVHEKLELIVHIYPLKIPQVPVWNS